MNKTGLVIAAIALLSVIGGVVLWQQFKLPPQTVQAAPEHRIARGEYVRTCQKWIPTAYPMLTRHIYG